jgi:hypothetical protein
LTTWKFNPALPAAMCTVVRPSLPYTVAFHGVRSSRIEADRRRRRYPTGDEICTSAEIGMVCHAPALALIGAAAE